MEVVFYGRLADAIARKVTVDVPAAGCSVAQLRQRLADEYPSLARDLASERIRACIGDTIVSDNTPIGPGATVEFFPPVSGG